MFNVQQITSRLAEMSDAQLAQYARMHKDDPYVLPLAASEFKRRQQMRQGAAAQNVQKQPSVADQAVSQMLPEQQGIGVLPAQNLETMGMADGGIVAFADGGFFNTTSPEYEQGTGLSYGQQMSNVGQFFSDAFRRIVSDPSMDDRQKAKAVDALKKQTGISEADAAAARNFAIAEESAPAKKAAAAPAVKGTPSAGGIAAVAPQRTQTTPASQAPTLSDAYKQAKGFGEDEDIRKRLSDYETSMETGITAERKRREEARPQGEAFSKYEELLNREAAKDKEKEDRNLKMALINAGLAIAGGKSQYALQNIAEGAQVGTKQYKEGLEKLEETARLRNKEIAAIEEARRAEARGDWEKQNAFEEKALGLRMEGKKMGIDAIAKITDTNKKVASDIFNTATTNASREKIAAEQNVNELAKARIMASAYGSRLGTRGEITPALALKEYNDLLQKDTLGDFKKQFPNFESYFAALQGQGPAAALGAATPSKEDASLIDKWLGKK